MKRIEVRSVVIHWPEEQLEITGKDDEKHTLPLDTTITVMMIGYPEREEHTMKAAQLDRYITRGYVIEEISYREK